MKAPVLNLEGQQVAEMDVKESVFGRKANREFLHEFVTVYLMNQRVGTAHTKTRAEVSGGGHKPWKQKHTGRARAGSNRSPLWRHGGVTFGPRFKGAPRRDFPRRKSQEALAQALSARYQDGGVVFVESFSMAEAKTKTVSQFLSKLNFKGNAVFVVEKTDEKLLMAVRNIRGLRVAHPGDLNAYLVLQSKKLVISRAAFESLSARWN